jgi:uncharacterized protein
MGIPERWIGYRPMPRDIERHLGRLIPLFEMEGVVLAYLFGSLSRNDGNSSREPHDVDLGILTLEGSAHRLHDEVTQILETDRLDLVDLRMADPMLRFEILRKGKPIYIADDDYKENFILMTLHEYRETEPMRRQQKVYLRERVAGWLSGLKG